jgi:hypothetical protein
VKKEDTIWSKSILEAADYKCQYPGCKRVACDPHHIIPRRARATRNDPNNGIALCRLHHDWVEQHPKEAKKMGLKSLTSSVPINKFSLLDD